MQVLINLTVGDPTQPPLCDQLAEAHAQIRAIIARERGNFAGPAAASCAHFEVNPETDAAGCDCGALWTKAGGWS